MRLLVFDDPTLERRYEWLAEDADVHDAMRALGRQAYRRSRRPLPEDSLSDQLRAYGTVDAAPYIPER